MRKVHCSLSYHQLPDEALDDFATGVKTGISANPLLFPALPVSAVALQAFIDDYEVKRSAYKRGGLDQRPAFTNAKISLITALDTTAEYVDSVANGSEAIIVAGGFIPTKAASTPLAIPAKPAVVTVKHGQAHGQLLAECNSINGADNYGCIVTEGSPFTAINFENGQFVLPANTALTVGFDLNKSRKKVFSGLNIGTTYYFYFYAVNSAGVSALSEPVSIMVV